jgi:hypothetical protein
VSILWLTCITKQGFTHGRCVTLQVYAPTRPSHLGRAPLAHQQGRTNVPQTAQSAAPAVHLASLALSVEQSSSVSSCAWKTLLRLLHNCSLGMYCCSSVPSTLCSGCGHGILITTTTSSSSCLLSCRHPSITCKQSHPGSLELCQVAHAAQLQLWCIRNSCHAMSSHQWCLHPS